MLKQRGGLRKGSAGQQEQTNRPYQIQVPNQASESPCSNNKASYDADWLINAFNAQSSSCAARKGPVYAGAIRRPKRNRQDVRISTPSTLSNGQPTRKKHDFNHLDHRTVKVGQRQLTIGEDRKRVLTGCLPLLCQSGTAMGVILPRRLFTGTQIGVAARGRTAAGCPVEAGRSRVSLRMQDDLGGHHPPAQQIDKGLPPSLNARASVQSSAPSLPSNIACAVSRKSCIV